jgi:prepilin-type N-terminal cleavage/methylation domain-containing protein
MIPIRPKHNHNGLTLVELLIAMVVTSIVLTAVATLAYALGTANDSSDDTAVKQAQLRYATLRISELIKYSKLVYAASESEIVLWLDRDRNGELDFAAELVAITKVTLAGGDMQLCEFNSDPEPVVLIPQCRNVEFMLDSAPPDTKFVGISFESQEKDVWHKYQISATVRCKAG